jgi:hypothetical protein
VVHGPITGEVELVAERQEDERGSSSSKRESNITVFEERLRLQTEGDVYDPELFLYSAAVGLGLTQQDLDTDTESDRTNDTLNEYNLSGQLLRSKQFPINFNTSKHENLIPRQFAGPMRTESETSSISMSLRSQDWPMLFQYGTNDETQKSLGLTAGDFFERNSEHFGYYLTHDFSELSRMRFRFDRSDVTTKNRVASAKNNLRSDKYSLVHNLIFGSDKRHRLDSYIDYLDQSGRNTVRDFQWRERMKLRHTPDFATIYRFKYSDTQRDTLKNKQILGNAGFEHMLYDSLFTTGNVFASRTEFDPEGLLKRYGGRLAFDYKKKNRWGTLLSRYNVSYTDSERTADDSTGIVIDESHIFTDPLPVILDRVNIDPTTIVVTDSTGLDVYTEGDDYTIEQINGRTRLHLTTLGLIPPNITDGQEVLVDYNFFIEPERTEKTLRQNFSLRERFENGLELYYRHQRQDQDDKSNVTEVVDDEFRLNTFGARYFKSGFSVNAVYSKMRSTQIPSEHLGLDAQYSWRISTDTSAGFKVSNQWLEFEEEEVSTRDVELFSTSGTLTTRLTDRHNLSAYIDYRDEDDSKQGKVRGFRFSSELQYFYRQLEAIVGFELNSLERRTDESDSIFMYMRIRRFF